MCSSTLFPVSSASLSISRTFKIMSVARCACALACMMSFLSLCSDGDIVNANNAADLATYVGVAPQANPGGVYGS